MLLMLSEIAKIGYPQNCVIP